MREKVRIAVIGGGPAGAMAAACLAQGGRAVAVFDEKLVWEKPCGGGITHKALTQYPFLVDAQVERNLVDACELISPAGLRLWLPLGHQIAIFSRRILNGLLLERAQRAGADVVHDRVLGITRQDGNWRLRTRCGELTADYVVVAAGARNPFRAQFAPPLSAEDFMATVGYFIPGNGRHMQVRFLPGLHGYIWVFPRCDHLSAGICGRMSDRSTAEMRELLEDFLRAEGLDFRAAPVYAHLLPAPRAETLQAGPYAGDGWAIVGDAAALVDPITGEGLYYALRSADLLAQAIVAGRPEAYPEMLRRDFLPDIEVAARFAGRFFGGSFMGGAVTERTVQFAVMSRHFRLLLQDLFAGFQGYRGLRRRAYCNVPRALLEAGMNRVMRRTADLSTGTARAGSQNPAAGSMRGPRSG